MCVCRLYVKRSDEGGFWQGACQSKSAKSDKFREYFIHHNSTPFRQRASHDRYWSCSSSRYGIFRSARIAALCAGERRRQKGLGGSPLPTGSSSYGASAAREGESMGQVAPLSLRAAMHVRKEKQLAASLVVISFSKWRAESRGSSRFLRHSRTRPCPLGFWPGGQGVTERFCALEVLPTLVPPNPGIVP